MGCNTSKRQQVQEQEKSTANNTQSATAPSETVATDNTDMKPENTKRPLTIVLFGPPG
jgi:hypothetical protein